MARIASESKAGFYATPMSQVEIISSILRGRRGTTIHLFDPCCGKGNTLERFAEILSSRGINVITYGIELEADRALSAKEKLDCVLQSPYEDTRVTPASMSFMWLNPPYSERAGERAEVVFLRDLTRPGNGKLQIGGLLGFCIPQKVLSSAATVLATRFENIQVYRFTDSEFSTYKQVVVFAYRCTGKSSDDIHDERAKLKLLATTELPTLDKARFVYIKPATCEMTTFLSNTLSPELVKATLDGSPLLDNAKKHAPHPPRFLTPPLMALKPSHIGVTIAAGAVGGNFGNHILVGTTKRDVSVEEELTETGTKRIETQQIRSIIRLFGKDGISVLN